MSKPESSIHAQRLYKKSNLQQIAIRVNEIYRAVRAKIEEAHQSGAAELIYDLPDNFAIASLDLSDAQLIVYTRLMERLEKEDGLKVSHRQSKTGVPQLRVRWPSILDPMEKARLKAFFISHIDSGD